MPKKYDTDFQAFRSNFLHTLRNMDPDDLVDELAIDTDTLIEALWIQIELHIAKEYEDNDDQDESL